MRNKERIPIIALSIPPPSYNYQTMKSLKQIALIPILLLILLFNTNPAHACMIEPTAWFNYEVKVEKKNLPQYIDMEVMPWGDVFFTNLKPEIPFKLVSKEPINKSGNKEQFFNPIVEGVLDRDKIGISSKERGQKPENAKVPETINFTINIIYDDSTIQLPGTITFSHNPNYSKEGDQVYQRYLDHGGDCRVIAQTDTEIWLDNNKYILMIGGIFVLGAVLGLGVFGAVVYKRKK
jgi:hypothetical protein